MLCFFTAYHQKKSGGRCWCCSCSHVDIDWTKGTLWLYQWSKEVMESHHQGQLLLEEEFCSLLKQLLLVSLPHALCRE